MLDTFFFVSICNNADYNHLGFVVIPRDAYKKTCNGTYFPLLTLVGQILFD